MRSTTWRPVVGVLGVLLVAGGCYSSIAPTAKIDLGETDSGLPIEPPAADACVPRKPWDGPGVTGILPLTATTALVLSGDRYFTGEFQTGGSDAGDPGLGRLIAWHQTGLLQRLWADAPSAVGQVPWDEPGVTAAYIDKVGGRQVVISRFRRWVHEAQGWPSAGTVMDDWRINDAGPPPPLDAQAAPWEGAGVTATYFRPGGNTLVVISQARGWLRNTSGVDPKAWAWEGSFELASTAPWSGAPPIAGQLPWDGPGVTAAYYIGPKFFAVSVDKLWGYDGTRWTTGMLKDTSGWSSAPAAGCP